MPGTFFFRILKQNVFGDVFVPVSQAATNQKYIAN